MDVRVELVDWTESESIIRAVRDVVFIAEQAVPEELEWDGADPVCSHVMAWNEVGGAVGTARMQTDGTIGRMAVLKEWRRCGVGAALLRVLLDLAARQGLSQVRLAAQIHAIGFYERSGFHAIGDPFLDAGIPHRLMVKDLLLPDAFSEKK
jgi:predicted GNAT family N-acyltransferase